MQDSQAPWAPGLAQPRPAAVPPRLMQRLLDALRKARTPDALKPAGARSGRGAKSVQPYLEEARKSRPAPLE